MKVIQTVLLLLLLQGFSWADKRVIEIPSKDDVVLAASYFSPGKAGPGAVLFRNCDEERGSLDGFAAHLAERGIHVVTYDYRSKNPGSGAQWFENRIDDMRAVHDWLVKQESVDKTRLVTAGGSCGVSMAL